MAYMRGHIKVVSKLSFPQAKRACRQEGRESVLGEDKQPIPDEPE